MSKRKVKVTQPDIKELFGVHHYFVQDSEDKLEIVECSVGSIIAYHEDYIELEIWGDKVVSKNISLDQLDETPEEAVKRWKTAQVKKATKEMNRMLRAFKGE